MSTLLLPATIPPPSIPLRFRTQPTPILVHGYQMYAVEKWILERNRPVTVLLVYTGDPAHKVSVFALTPLPDLSPADAQLEWDKALSHLRRDGARPKQTPHGVLMATSLAHFRSDYTIVLIPDGNFPAVRDQLYTNINLLRMGCSGRSALTLEDPSDATKSRFTSSYRFPDFISSSSSSHPLTSTETLSLTKTRSHSTSIPPFTKYSPSADSQTPSSLSKAKTSIGLGLPSTLTEPRQKDKRDNTLLIATVLEFIKLIQAGLSLFGMYPCASNKLDGLLCDETVDGIRRWILEIGQPCLGLEPMERIADPSFVAAIISLVLCIRNKLAGIGFAQLVPKDPFLNPTLFLNALSAYVQSTNPAPPSPNRPDAPAHTPSFLSTSSHHTTSSSISHQQGLPVFGVPGGSHIFPPSFLLPPPHNHHHQHHSQSSSSSSSALHHHHHPNQVIHLTPDLISSISHTYDSKIGNTPERGHVRVRRALREKLLAGVESDRDKDHYYNWDAGHDEYVSYTGGGGAGGSRDRDRERDRDRDRERDRDRDRGERERERETLGGVGTNLSSSGGQILSGIGSFASGLGLGPNPHSITTTTGGPGVGGAGGGSGGGGGASSVLGGTCDLGVLVRDLYPRDHHGRSGKGLISGVGVGVGVAGGKRDRKGKGKDLNMTMTMTMGVGGDNGDPASGAGGGGGPSSKERDRDSKDKDNGVGVSVKALWSGQVFALIKLREWDVEREKMAHANAAAVLSSSSPATPGGAAAAAGTTTPDRKRREGTGTRWRRAAAAAAAAEDARDRDRWALSDGDVDDSTGTPGRGRGRGAGNGARAGVNPMPKSETEEESDTAIQQGSFRGMWGERMQKKLGSWAGLSKKRGGNLSLDLTTSLSRGDSFLPPPPPAQPQMDGSMATARPSDVNSRGVSPLLPPMVFSGNDNEDDDDLLSSGQVSPVDNVRPNPFTLLHDGHSLESTSILGGTAAAGAPTTTTTTTTSLAARDYERKVTEFNLKRPFGSRGLVPPGQYGYRITSWADPFSSAREFSLDEEGGTLEGGGSSVRSSGGESGIGIGAVGGRRRARGGTVGSLATSTTGVTSAGGAGTGGGGGAGNVLSDVVSEDWEDEEGMRSVGEYEGFVVRRREMVGANRRRSFHDIQSLRGMRIIPVEHMRVDVALSGQILIMTRREQHLQNVIACLHLLTSSLSSTNSHLREDYTSHIPFISSLDTHAQIISGIDAENAKADKMSQATNTLRYEAEQFRIPDLWHTATPSRQKVFQLREKVFGTGGRRLPVGVHGAHGRFNRLQWTLDGKERLVDYLGRTESEAEEEEPGVPYLGTTMEEEDEEDVVKHPGIKPMWLLRFFTSWGARWGASAPASTPLASDQPAEDKKAETTTTSGVLSANGNGKHHNDSASSLEYFDLPLEKEDSSSKSASSVAFPAS